MVKRLATSPHDPLGITDSACKNQSVVVSVQYGPFNPYIPIRSTTIDSIGYPRMSASGESSTTMHRLLHASGSHPIPTPGDPNSLPPNDVAQESLLGQPAHIKADTSSGINLHVTQPTGAPSGLKSLNMSPPYHTASIDYSHRPIALTSSQAQQLTVSADHPRDT
ncbi:hypothetical protein F511_18527 [Dorcoceras hygrometricum]|uniref:Uncharacterized protein n=1 Tax=Dorcoceras hygrometricum TaxID=472368 RepID=A0A2Z7BC75_9LAMI|nr:hypothetical protein F511_18527 [Dorcoceras hygrometricum]